MFRCALVVLMLATVAVAVPAFARESGIQITRQGPSIILVQKDVGGERWAINVSLEESWPLEITGNVFGSDGHPVFMQCRPIDVLNESAPLPQRTIVYNCYAADTCTAAPCSAGAWRFIAEVPIQGSFLIP